MSVANFFSSNVKWIAIAGGGIVLSLFVGGLCCCVRKRRRARERKGRVRIPESDWNASLSEEGNLTPPLENRPDFNRSWRERGSDATEHGGGSWRSIPTVSSAEMSEHSLTAIVPPAPAYPSRASPQTSPRLPSEPRSSQARRVLRRPRSSGNTLSMATPSQSSLGQATDASTTSTPLVDDSSASTRPLLSVTTTPPTPPIPSPAIPAQNPPIVRPISPPPYSFVEITPGMLAGGPPRRPEPRSHRALALAHALAAPQPLAPETPRSAMSVLPDYTSRASTPTPTVRDGNLSGAFAGY